MQQVANYLAQKAYRSAFVRLWVLGSDSPTLREWERLCGNTQALAMAKAACAAALDAERNVDPQTVAANPLAALQALDEYLFSGRALSAPSLRRSNRAATQIEQDGKQYWLVPVLLFNRRAAALSKQTGNLSHWVHHHCVLPSETPHGVKVALQHTQSTVDDKLHALWSDETPSLKVWIAHFDDNATVKGSTTHSAGGDWRATHIEPGEDRMASLYRTIDLAQAAGAQLIVFPELTIDVAQRVLLAKRLRQQAVDHLVLIQIGSFHETIATEGKTFNTAPLLTAQGNTVLTHRKLRAFSKVAPDADPVTEDISLGDTLHILATPVGLLTVLICKDFLDAHASMLSLLSDAPVEWVLVPSFGDEKTVRLHKARAKELGLVRTGSHTVLAQIFSNVDDPSRQPTECVRGFGHIGGKTSPEPQVPESGGLVVFPLQGEAPRKSPPQRISILKRVK